MLIPRSKTIITICITCFICGLLTVDYGLIYGQDNYLRVKGKTRADTLRFEGNLSDYPLTPLEGELFYHSSSKYLKYFDGRNWMGFGSGPKVVASVLVAAKDSANRSAADYLCDGTDDQVEIQQAIDALNNPATGTMPGAVYLLEGTYDISGAINLNNTAPDDSGKSIIGAGKATVLKVKAGATGINVINVSVVDGVLISQLMIDGTGTTNSCGVYFEQATRCKVDKVWIENITDGVMLVSSSYNTVSNSHFNNARVRTAQAAGFGFSENNIISDNSFQGSSTSALVVLNSANNNIVSNNNVQNSTAAGIRMESGHNNIISQNNVQDNGEEGILLTGTAVSFNNISDNNVQGNSRAGIRLDNAPKDNIITANTIYDNGQALPYDGINISQDADRNIISFNSIIDSGGSGYGINILTSDCTDNYLIGNLIDGAGYSGQAMKDLGTNTKYTDRRKITLEKTQLDISDLFPTLDFATSPQGYVALNPSVNTSLSLVNGRSAGDLLILENISGTRTVKINDGVGGNVNLEGNIELGQYDILKLIWNGSKWLQVDYVDNQPTP